MPLLLYKACRLAASKCRGSYAFLIRRILHLLYTRYFASCLTKPTDACYSLTES
jgi:hypothetical protein